jgi:hypothetical protein
MSTRGFSRRDLLHLGGKVVLTVGAAKIVVALPGCGDDGGGSIDGAPPDAALPIDAYSPYGYALDDCHYVGTYHYPQSSAGSTYHYYFEHAYGCPYYLYYPYDGVYCYPVPDFVPGYYYFCFTGTYYTVTTP